MRKGYPKLKCYKLDWETGQVLHTYSSVSEAAKSNRIRQSTLSESLAHRNGRLVKRRLRFACDRTNFGYDEELVKETAAMAKYIINNNVSIGKATVEFQISASTAYYRLYVILPATNEQLNNKFKALLESRKNDGHFYKGHMKIEQLDYYTGELVGEYDTMTKAAEDNYVSLAAVSKAIKSNNGKLDDKKLMFRKVAYS